jgi:hypothetical protein
MSIKLMFPLGAWIGLDRKDKTFFDLLALDAAYLHITAFAAGAFIDKIMRQRDPWDNRETALHFLRGIELLRKKFVLEDEKAQISDATVAVVLTLANSAYGTGEYEAAKRHLEGLNKIVKIRGGIDSFEGQFPKKLMLEILR